MAQKKVSDEKVEITVEGITVHVAPDINDDFEMLEYLVLIDEGNNAASVQGLKKMFGDEYERVKDELRDERGIISTKKMGRLFYSVLGKLSKNS